MIELIFRRYLKELSKAACYEMLLSENPGWGFRDLRNVAAPSEWTVEESIEELYYDKDSRMRPPVMFAQEGVDSLCLAFVYPASTRETFEISVQNKVMDCILTAIPEADSVEIVEENDNYHVLVFQEEESDEPLVLGAFHKVEKFYKNNKGFLVFLNVSSCEELWKESAIFDRN